jgi:AhpD family alkylhydroperoxidase
MKIMARRPDLLEAFSGLAFAVMTGGVLEPSLRPLITWAASAAYGCNYCQAHTVHSAQKAGITDAKISAFPAFETSDLFTSAERAAMVFAQCVAHSAGMAGEKEQAELKRHFSEEEIFDIVALVSLFGFLNRWNDTMETPLEGKPSALASQHLPGWEVGRHSD